MLFQRPKSEKVEAEAEALAKYRDPELAALHREDAYGDALSRSGARRHADDKGEMAALIFAGVMFCGELLFAWFSGAALFPQLQVDGHRVGGILTGANSCLFIWLVHLYMRDRVPAEEGVRSKTLNRFARNPWGGPLAACALFAFGSIFVSQTNAAEDVKEVVDERDRLQAEILQYRAQLNDPLQPTDARLEVNLKDAQDEVVGWRLNTVPEETAIEYCAGQPDFAAREECRKQTLRDSIDCTQDIDPRARDVCNRVTAYRGQIEDRAAWRKQIVENEAAIEALPDVTNVWIESIAKSTGWELDETTSRVYVFLALVFLLVPAWIFARTLKRRQIEEAAGA